VAQSPAIRQGGKHVFQRGSAAKTLSGEEVENFTSRDKALAFASDIGKKVATSGVDSIRAVAPMNIACLGWGSLVWDPRSLPVRGHWFRDGPLLPVEFTRCSEDGRMTLVLDSEAQPVRVLWSLLSLHVPADAAKALREREGVLPKNAPDRIATWTSAEPGTYPSAEIIGPWAQRQGLDAVVWTALGFKHPDLTRTERPDCPTVVQYLRGLRYERQRLAEEYVRRTPPQIDTDYRRAIEKELGWTSVQSQ
jgi:hypothetical protein